MTYGGKTASFNVTVNEDTLQSIAIKDMPTKTSYYTGQTLDTAGLTLTATFASGKTETVSSGFTCSPTALNTAGTQKITVTYSGKTASFNVTVNENTLQGIAIKDMPTKTSYYTGQTLDTTGLTLTATFASGKTETVSSGFTCSPTALNSAGTKTITVTYGGKTATFTVTVTQDSVKSISIKSKPTKLTYFVGDSLVPDGLTLTATYNSGKTATVSSGFTCSPTTLNTAGTQKITVTYSGKTASFNVTVNAIPTYTVTFAMNGGSFETVPAGLVSDGENYSYTAQEGSPVAKPSSDPVKEQYVFLGWFTDDGCTNPVNWTGFTVPQSGAVVYAGWEKAQVPKLMPAQGSTLMIERRDTNGNAVVETENQNVLDGTEPLPNGVSKAEEAYNTDYNEYPHYPEDSKEYDSWFIYGIEPYTTPDELVALIGSEEYNCVISNVTGSYVGTGTIVKIFDKNGNFIEQFRVVIYGDLDNSGSVTSSDTNIAIQESKRPSWSKASEEDRVPYMYRAANVDQSTSFSSSDANLLIMCNKNKAEIDQATGKANGK